MSKADRVVRDCRLCPFSRWQRAVQDYDCSAKSTHGRLIRRNTGKPPSWCPLPITVRREADHD